MYRRKGGGRREQDEVADKWERKNYNEDDDGERR